MGRIEHPGWRKQALGRLQILRHRPQHLQAHIGGHHAGARAHQNRVTRQFAQALSGSVVDDSGRVLDDASIARIRAQLASMLKAMRARGIEPGDAIARRIFG
jgi:hypothetical protein